MQDIARAITGPCGGVPSPPMPSEIRQYDMCHTRTSRNISPVSGPSGSPEQALLSQSEDCHANSASDRNSEQAHTGSAGTHTDLTGDCNTPQRCGKSASPYTEDGRGHDTLETPQSCPPQRCNESASPYAGGQAHNMHEHETPFSCPPRRYGESTSPYRGRKINDMRGTPLSCPPQRIEDISGAATPKSGSGMGWEEKEECCVCGALANETEGGGSNPLFKCKSCGIKVHKACYGIEQQHVSSWQCQPCEQGHVAAAKLKCKLCPHSGSAMKMTKCREWVHILCALWVSTVFQREF